MAQYDGHVDVSVPSEATQAEIKAAAVRKLQRMAFADRGASSWRVVKYEIAPEKICYEKT
jgi:hypothetical protein